MQIISVNSFIFPPEAGESINILVDTGFEIIPFNVLPFVKPFSDSNYNNVQPNYDATIIKDDMTLTEF